jgi:hypothetical protein
LHYRSEFAFKIAFVFVLKCKTVPTLLRKLFQINDKPTSTANIPYTQATCGRLSRMLAKHNIKSVALPSKNIFSYRPPGKDALGLRARGIYSIPCECCRVYFGQSGHPSKSESKSTIDI